MTAQQQSGFAATDVLINEFGDGPDTVERARETPEELQPHTELGLKDDEYDRIRQILGRRPTASELAMYSIMWSEHCSYKSSKVHLRQFGEKTPKNTRMLAGIGENAGVVQISDEHAVAFKVESHNHPSFVEPYQGAATGVGGIVRDILAMGARPVAVMDPLRFGAAECCPAWSAASAATATAWACPTSAARSSSTPPTRATRWSTR
jgi:phosphoribosylformylglycinamidine synthase subunit PurL